MRMHPLGTENLHLYRDLLLTVVKARITMDTASARAEILLNIFLVTVEHLGTEEIFAERCISHLELDMLDSRDAPGPLRDATADMARAIWKYRTNPTSKTDQSARDEFEHWETVYQQSIGESPAEAYMDIENARCLSTRLLSAQHSKSIGCAAHSEAGTTFGRGQLQGVRREQDVHT